MNMAVLDLIPYIPIRDTKWVYRGEGNANLVITLPQEKIILRMEKCSNEVETTCEIITLRANKLRRDVLFYKNVIVPFLGKVFLQPPCLAKISKDDVSFLNEELIGQRPKYRLDKSIRYEMVTVHPDYTYLPPVLSQNVVNAESERITYCIEIKPKQGWVYPADRHHPKCTYCLNQYLKVKKKRVHRISHYCPLDLFSGNVQRMKKAIKSLLITPQNNLKIFQNGDPVYSDETKGNYITILKEWFEPDESEGKVGRKRLLDKWSDLLIGALLRELTEELPYNLLESDCDLKNSTYTSEASPLSGIISTCDWSANELPNNCILQRILMIQKLQDIPFPGLYSLYCQKKKTEEDYSYVERLLNSNDPPGPVERYLLSTTAKDCSIFIAFQQTDLQEKNSNFIQDCDGISYCMNIGISDIDPKPLSCIEKHYKRDKEIVDTILKHAVAH